jgi:hypothetical protein
MQYNIWRHEKIKEAERAVLHKKEEITRLESERAELLVQIEAGEGASTAIQQLSQEKVTPFREFVALSLCVILFF